MNQRFAFALSPKQNMEPAVRFLEHDIKNRRAEGLAQMITFLDDGIHYVHTDGDSKFTLPQLIGQMPDQVRAQLDGTVFVSDMLPSPKALTQGGPSHPQLPFYAAMRQSVSSDFRS